MQHECMTSSPPAPQATCAAPAAATPNPPACPRPSAAGRLGSGAQRLAVPPRLQSSIHPATKKISRVLPALGQRVCRGQAGQGQAGHPQQCGCACQQAPLQLFCCRLVACWWVQRARTRHLVWVHQDGYFAVCFRHIARAAAPHGAPQLIRLGVGQLQQPAGGTPGHSASLCSFHAGAAL